MREKKVLPLHSLKGSSSHESPVQPKMASGVGNQSLLSQLGTGHAMPEPVQAKMEESFGADFSGVRLFESPVVSDNGAQAVASGKNIAFAPGQLDLNSSKGLGLLGHELSHVASQARGVVSGHGFVNDSALEHKADAEGAKAASAFDSLSGQTLTPMSTAGAPASPAGPMQAKKEEKPLSTADKLRYLLDAKQHTDQYSWYEQMARLSGYVNAPNELYALADGDRFHTFGDTEMRDLYEEKLKTMSPTALTSMQMNAAKKMANFRVEWQDSSGNVAHDYRNARRLTRDFGQRVGFNLEQRIHRPMYESDGYGGIDYNKQSKWHWRNNDDIYSHEGINYLKHADEVADVDITQLEKNHGRLWGGAKDFNSSRYWYNEGIEEEYNDLKFQELPHWKQKMILRKRARQAKKEKKRAQRGW